jgi:hypothetical protein
MARFKPRTVQKEDNAFLPRGTVIARIMDAQCCRAFGRKVPAHKLTKVHRIVLEFFGKHDIITIVTPDLTPRL